MEISFSSLAAQIINFGIMFFLFSKFVAKPISKQIEDRRRLIEKIKKADELYKEKIEEAEKKAESIISDGLVKKESIITEWESLALKKQIEIIQEANKKADKITSDANNSAKVLSAELEKNFIDSVKKTSKVVVKKLLQKDLDLQKSYLDEIIKEAI